MAMKLQMLMNSPGRGSASFGADATPRASAELPKTSNATSSLTRGVAALANADTLARDRAASQGCAPSARPQANGLHEMVPWHPSPLHAGKQRDASQWVMLSHSAPTPAASASPPSLERAGEVVMDIRRFGAAAGSAQAASSGDASGRQSKASISPRPMQFNLQDGPAAPWTSNDKRALSKRTPNLGGASGFGERVEEDDVSSADTDSDTDSDSDEDDSEDDDDDDATVIMPGPKRRATETAGRRTVAAAAVTKIASDDSDDDKPGVQGTVVDEDDEIEEVFIRRERADSPEVATAEDNYDEEQDDANYHRVREILGQQFNLEIMLKRHELRVIEEQIHKAEALLWDIKQKYLDDLVKADYLNSRQKSMRRSTTNNTIATRNLHAQNVQAAAAASTPAAASRASANSASALAHARRHSTASSGVAGVMETAHLAGRHVGTPAGIPRAGPAYSQSQPGAQPIDRVACPACARVGFASRSSLIRHCRERHQNSFDANALLHNVIVPSEVSVASARGSAVHGGLYDDDDEDDEDDIDLEDDLMEDDDDEEDIEMDDSKVNLKRSAQRRRRRKATIDAKPLKLVVPKNGVSYSSPAAHPASSRPSQPGTLPSERPHKSDKNYRGDSVNTVAYYVRVGNTSTMIPMRDRRPKEEHLTHQWTVRLAPGLKTPPLETFIQSVVFRLHSTYAPNDVVTVERPPFEISNKGWGEAPVAIELYLHDVFVHRGENPVYLIHNLTLRPSGRIKEHSIKVRRPNVIELSEDEDDEKDDGMDEDIR